MSDLSSAQAARRAALRNIPPKLATLEVGTSAKTINLAALVAGGGNTITDESGDSLATAVDLRGRWVHLQAVDADVTLMRGTPTAAAGRGVVLEASGYFRDAEEFNVPTAAEVGDTYQVRAIGGDAAAKLRIFWDDEV